MLVACEITQKDVIRLNKAVNGTYSGVSGIGSVYNLRVEKDQSSFHTVWLQSGPPDRLNVLAAGWTVRSYSTKLKL